MKSFKLFKYGTILFLTGFAALVYEIVFIKTLSLFLGQSIYAFSVMLAAFMFGIGIGSMMALKFKDEPLWYFAITQMGIALFSLIFIPLLNNISIPVFLAAKMPFYLKTGFLAFISLLMLIIPTSLMGLSFPLLVRHVMEINNDKNLIGRLFAYNTMGGLLGSLAAGFIFLPEFGVTASLIIAAVINLTVAASIKTKAFPKRIAAAVVLLALLIFARPEIDTHTVGSFYNTENYDSLADFISSTEQARDSSEVLYSDFDVYGHVSVTKQGPYKTLSINGKPDGGTSEDITTQLLIGYIPMLLHDKPETAAVIGLGTGLTAGAVLQFDIDRVDVYEINPGVVEANSYFAEESHHALSNPKTNLIMGDARRNLALSNKIYDVIISEPSNPWVEGEGFLFTREYYEIVDKHLNKDGIFVQWIGSYDYTEEAFDILLNTLYNIFPHIQLWSDGSDFYLISSREQKRFNFYNAAAKIREPVISADMELIGYFEGKDIEPVDIFFSHYITDYVKTEETKINTDDNSIIEFSTGRYTGKAVNHILRLVNNATRVLPVDLNTNDFDITIESDMPVSEIKYLITQAGSAYIINKQILFREGLNTFFVQTQIQSEQPDFEQARELADFFNADVSESDRYLFSFKGEDAHGVVGYCPDVRKSFVAYSTIADEIIVNCK